MSLPVLLSLALFTADPAPSAAAPAQAMSDADMLAVLKLTDERQRATGDYKALAYIEQKEKDKADIVREVLVYRRDADEKLMLLFTKPKSEEGKGYLRLEKNLWSYDPGTGKWERTTERERIGGTNSRRSDFDQSRLAEEYIPSYGGKEKLGKVETFRLDLKARPGVDVAYPVVKLWFDEANQNVMKRSEYALSGKLARTAYYPEWNKLYSASKKGEVWFPKRIVIFDELERTNQTLVIFKGVDLSSLDANMFTKAWLESKSR